MTSLMDTPENLDARGEIALAVSTAVIRLVRNTERLRNRRAREAGLGQTEYRALARIAESNDMTPRELATVLGITTGTVTALTDRMESAGVIVKAPHPHDRRSTLLTLSETGHLMMAAAYADYRRNMRQTLDGFELVEIGEFHSMLTAVADAIAVEADRA